MKIIKHALSRILLGLLIMVAMLSGLFFIEYFLAVMAASAILSGAYVIGYLIIEAAKEVIAKNDD